jgi:quercetin dioxygenase-like cupin family protein
MTIEAPTNVQPKLVRQQEGKILDAGIDTIQFKLNAEDTGGAFSLGLVTTSPGGGPPLHVHRREDELFIILEGELEALTPSGWVTARPGDVIYLPADVPHTYRNAGTIPAKFWVLANPAGFESFYEAFVAVMKAPGGPNPERMAATAQAYGIEFLPTPQS